MSVIFYRPVGTHNGGNSSAGVPAIEQKFLSIYSFVPDYSQISSAITTAIHVENVLGSAIKHTIRPYLSKLHKFPFAGPAKLLPESMKPSDTILATEGAKANLRNDYFAIIDDQPMPFTTSAGPNGVLCTFDDDEGYGENRVNLFTGTPMGTSRMLRDYLAFRNANAGKILHGFATKLKSHQNYEYQIKIGQDPTLDANLVHAYDMVVEMFIHLANKIPFTARIDTLHLYGIYINSFCQTWGSMTTGPDSEGYTPPEFSVMSPHFQTKLIVEDTTQMQAMVPKITDYHLEAYATMMNNLSDNWAKVPYDGKFVNLDGLAQRINGSNFPL